MILFRGLLWCIITLLPLAFLQRLLHREIQASFLILSRSPEFSIALFSIIFLPGVVLHEFSHYLTALILGVQTAHFSLIPQMLPNGRLQLGYVETMKSDVFRDSLIGAAPLIVGGSVVALLAVTRLELLPVWDALRTGQSELLWHELERLPSMPDFPLWLYLVFTISSTMLPSPSDRHAWLPVGGTIVGLLGVAVLAGAGPWMLEHVAPPLNKLLTSAAVVFGLSVVLHALLIIPTGLIHISLSKITGLDVE
jgi:hypothetical protein